jgi:hypothetical protein
MDGVKLPVDLLHQSALPLNAQNGTTPADQMPPDVVSRLLDPKRCKAVCFQAVFIAILLLAGLLSMFLFAMIAYEADRSAESPENANAGCHVCRLDSDEYCSFLKAAATGGRPCGMSCISWPQEFLQASVSMPHAAVACFGKECTVCVPDSEECDFGRKTNYGDYTCTMECIPGEEFDGPLNMPGEFVACFRHDIHTIV